MGKVKSGIASFFHAIGGFFKDFGTAVAKGDIFVKLSLIVVGAGYAGRKQYVKAILTTVLEVLLIWYSVAFAPQYISKFTTLGTVEYVPSNSLSIGGAAEATQAYDHSFLILLFSLITIVFWISAVILYMKNIIAVYELQNRAKAGKHINNFVEDLQDLLNHKFHVTLLFLPVLGIIVFTIFPLLVMICVAFTNYDQNHMPPSHLFTWVGFENFISLFSSGGMTVTFGYAFVRVLIWTLIWAFFATFTTYLGGILLALLINNKKTVLPKMWRGLFVVTIAVPQFVTLVLLRYFFSDNGIANAACKTIGLTAFLKAHGLISTSYIPFLSAPGWANVMVILINIWVGVPYQMLISTSILMNIPSDQLEAARIDGANSRQIFWKITMPYMLFVTGPTLVTDFVKNINNFNVIYLLTTGVYVSPNMNMANSSAKEVDLLVTWLFTLTQDKYNYKMASVIGIMVFLICAFFTLIAFNRLIKGDREEMFR